MTVTVSPFAGDARVLSARAFTIRRADGTEERIGRDDFEPVWLDGRIVALNLKVTLGDGDQVVWTD